MFSELLRQDRERSDLTVLGVVALLATIVYSALYPWRGYTVPVGLDTPVYLWSAHSAAALGLDAPGLLGRPGAFGAVATLLQLPVGGMTVIGAVQIAVIVAAALAAGALAGRVFGGRVGVIAGVTILVALFLTPLGDGYLSAAMFLASFTAGLAMVVDPARATWRASALAGASFAAGALSHPVFATIGVPVV